MEYEDIVDRLLVPIPSNFPNEHLTWEQCNAREAASVIKSLRAAGDALHAWIIVNATSQQQDMFGKVLAGWEEARRG